MNDILEKLHPHEKRILLALKELGMATPKDISEKTNLPEASIHKAAQWSKLKGLVDYEEEKKIKTALTEEGKRYLEEGLPEKILIKMVMNGEKKIKNLKTKHPRLDIALAWAKRLGWVEVKGDEIILTETGKRALSEETSVERGLKGQITEENINELKRRRLVEVKEITEKRLRLTPTGERIIPRIKKAVDEIGQITPEMLKTGSWKGKKFRKYDINTPVPVIVPAKHHPYSLFINRTRNKLISLGFQEVRGPWVETEFWNSDALFMPQDHPARGIHDIFRIKSKNKGRVLNKLVLERVSKTHKNGWITGSSGWGFWNPEQTLNLVLRSQTTSVSARTLACKPEVPGKYFTISRVFRPDKIDATHFVEFHQCEGIVIAENLTLRHLLGYLEIFGKEIAGAEKVRFRPAYFPFTEPSVELDCYFNGEWVEVAGAGIFRPEVTMPLGIDLPVLAWGMGFDRFAMIKLGINDIRTLYSHDLEWLRTKKII